LTDVIIRACAKARAVSGTVQCVAICSAPAGLAAAVTLTTALHIARHPSEAGVAHTQPAVHGHLVTIDAGVLARVAHPATRAIGALRRVETAVTEAAVVAVGPRAVGNLAAVTHPARVAEAELLLGIAGAVACAVDAHTGTSLAGTQWTPPARVTDAGTVAAMTVVRALAVTVGAIKARGWIALTNATIGRVLGPVDTGDGTHGAHPVVITAGALRGAERSIAESTTGAFGCATTLRDLASSTLPAGVTEALLGGRIAGAVACAV